MLFNVSVSYSLHNGRSKFYQNYVVSKIEDSGKVSRSVVIHHWGRVMPRPTPVSGGEVMVKAANGSGATELANQKQREKESRGYERWTTQNVSSMSFEEFHDYLTEHFTRPQKTQILVSLGIVPGSEAAIQEQDDKRKKEPVAAASSTLESWGEW